MSLTFDRRGLMLTAVGLAAAAPFRAALAAPAPVVAFHHDTPMLDTSGRSAPYRAAPAIPAILPDEAYAWRPFL